MKMNLGMYLIHLKKKAIFNGIKNHIIVALNGDANASETQELLFS